MRTEGSEGTRGPLQLPSLGNDRIALILHVTSLAAAAAYLMNIGRRQWFWGDEWDFLAHRTVSVHGLFAPHNEHWQTVPILVYRALFSLVGVRTYLPYFAVLVAVHLALAHLLFRSVTRSGGDPLLAALVVIPFLVNGAGSENTLWAFQIGFLGSVLAGVAAVLLVTRPAEPSHRGYVGVWVLGLVSVMCSGIGVTMVACIAIGAFLVGGWRRAAIAASVPTIAYVVWLELIGASGLKTHHATIDNVYLLPAYLWTGLTASYDAFTGFRGIGPLLVVWLVVSMTALARRPRAERDPKTPAVSLAIGVVVLFVVNGIGRAQFGVETAASGRYVYIALALTLPAVAVFLSRHLDHRVGRAVAASICLAMLVHNLGVFRGAVASESEREVRTRAEVLAAARLLDGAEGLVLEPLPEPATAPDLDVGSLRSMARDGKLPRVPAHRDALAQLAAATSLQVALSDHPLSDTAGRVQLAARQDVSVTPGRAGCQSLVPNGPTPVISLTADGPSVLALDAAAPGTLSVVLRSGSVVGPRRDVELPAGSSFLNLGAALAMDLGLPPGTSVELCGPLRGD